MVRILLTCMLATLAFVLIIHALAASARLQSATPHPDTGLLSSAPVETMPSPQEPLDETLITPVESAGAPMWL